MTLPLLRHGNGNPRTSGDPVSLHRRDSERLARFVGLKSETLCDTRYPAFFPSSPPFFSPPRLFLSFAKGYPLSFGLSFFRLFSLV